MKKATTTTKKLINPLKRKTRDKGARHFETRQRYWRNSGAISSVVSSPQVNCFKGFDGLCGLPAELSYK